MLIFGPKIPILVTITISFENPKVTFTFSLITVIRYNSDFIQIPFILMLKRKKLEKKLGPTFFTPPSNVFLTFSGSVEMDHWSEIG